MWVKRNRIHLQEEDGNGLFVLSTERHEQQHRAALAEGHARGVPFFFLQLRWIVSFEATDTNVSEKGLFFVRGRCRRTLSTATAVPIHVTFRCDVEGGDRPSFFGKGRQKQGRQGLSHFRLLS